MGCRRGLSEVFRAEAGAEFAFLVDDAGFWGPEQTDSGLLFHGSGLDVEVWFLDGHEPQVTTLIAPVASDGVRARGVWLDDLYVLSGCGPAQDVPGSAPTRRATLKRVQQHAAALRRLMPRLLTAEGAQLIARCRRG
ncbi:hypothetical protein EV284_1178 [Streptomyces sp. BK022]|uniref:hypothetical protein n=1 Tax=Streptomyces sp. BK022 TaxID=2512123 RepID=UPI0010E41911|nr:hypothetical protein [Streptomyces sp. BK022]RZU46497.1 hypothetical protein EV284_1178 [Streptomyces sp. BK022]